MRNNTGFATISAKRLWERICQKMRPINIYALTRIGDSDLIQRLERQMSGRANFLKIKEWETEGLRSFSSMLADKMDHSENICFYYSFIMPKLGKEFDLLRISDKSVVNIELKSGNITDEAIQRQLIKNRYYLAMLGKEIYSYTYISNEKRLVKLTNSDRIQDVDWSILVQNLTQQDQIYTGDIEELFQEEQYLISPLSDPEHFLRREYFLTSQQNDIKRKILKNIRENPGCIQGFTGLPGTGKSILLYDIAMNLSGKRKVCILHLGAWNQGFQVLNERLKRINFFCLEENDEVKLDDGYGAILVDEGHRITRKNLDGIQRYAKRMNIPVIFAYDCEDAVAVEERPENGMNQVEALPGFIKYQLTNRIRLNSELSSFVYQVMQYRKGYHRSYFPSVQLAYAGTEEEARTLLQIFSANDYQYIQNENLGKDLSTDKSGLSIKIASGLEFEQVVMLIDDTFWYDTAGNLRSKEGAKDGKSSVRSLYHGLTRAKKNIALVILNNENVFKHLLYMVQKNSL